jgi:hypothetical protein
MYVLQLVRKKTTVLAHGARRRETQCNCFVMSSTAIADDGDDSEDARVDVVLKETWRETVVEFEGDAAWKKGWLCWWWWGHVCVKHLLSFRCLMSVLSHTRDAVGWPSYG